MATIQVIDCDGDATRYISADKWVIDDAGRLHIINSKGNRASYNAGSWQAVAFITEAD